MHVAIIMDGNGRWAVRRGFPRTAGHREGAKAVQRAVEAAVERRIDVLTLYAFSSDNWKRPEGEVRSLMRLFEQYLKTEVRRCLRHSVRLSVIGRRDRLDASVVRAIERAEAQTSGCRGLHLRLAVDYSARETILRAAREIRRQYSDDFATFSRALAKAEHSADPVDAVDLLIRTGGQRRLSDFLLWECAYAEFHFTDRLWPDFTETDLDSAMTDFNHRERRFGGLALDAGVT